MTDVFRDLQLGDQLSQGAFGDGKKPDRFLVATPLVALRDVAGDTDRAPTNLINQAEVAGDPASNGQFIDVHRQRFRFLPHNQFPEPISAHKFAPLQSSLRPPTIANDPSPIAYRPSPIA